LRAVQEREILRLGDTKAIPIDVRLVAATLKDLRQEMSHRRFRDDLYYRIAEIELDLPPLRDRREDIPLLTGHFAARFAKEQGYKKAPAVSKELMRLFVEYAWPGNIRELANRVRVACALSDGKVIRVADLPEGDRALLSGGKVGRGVLFKEDDREFDGSEEGRKKFFEGLLGEKKTWKEIENILMAKTLLKSDFDVVRAARALDIGQATLYNRLRRERFRARRGEFAAIPFTLGEGISLETCKREVFRLAYAMHEERPYHAARGLGVSPGMFYRWMETEKT
jgi:DNA-binding NtrC family response regulator